jgi:hypothetical protein
LLLTPLPHKPTDEEGLQGQKVRHFETAELPTAIKPILAEVTDFHHAPISSLAVSTDEEMAKGK